MNKHYNLQEIHEENFREKVHTILKQEIRDFVNNNYNHFKKIKYCPACQQEEIKYRFMCLGFHHEECMICHTIFINPFPPEDLIVEFLNCSEGLRIWREDMPIYQQESRKKLYQQRLNIILESAENFENNEISLLEIGGGRGELAKELIQSKKIKDLYIVEPQELKINAPNVHIIRKTFQEVFLENKVDMVIAFEVFEHVLEPLPFLNKALECLSPGGIFVLTTPNGKSLEVDLLNENSSQVPFDHVRLYNPFCLEMMLKNTGFCDIIISTPGNLDVELLERACNQGNMVLSDNHFLKFILENEINKINFQKYMVGNNISSHMRCIARKPI